ncbi:MAG: hypothetical protein LIO51_03960 [Clostridiales bacterium]|nr:hypothetical protein [Clostridiales bacterium]
MRHKRGALMILPIVLLLSGCGWMGQSTEAKTEELRAVYQAMTGFQASAEITADYGDRAYQYTVTLSGNASAGTMTVTAPESIAGTGPPGPAAPPVWSMRASLWRQGRSPRTASPRRTPCR